MTSNYSKKCFRSSKETWTPGEFRTHGDEKGIRVEIVGDSDLTHSKYGVEMRLGQKTAATIHVDRESAQALAHFFSRLADTLED